MLNFLILQSSVFYRKNRYESVRRLPDLARLAHGYMDGGAGICAEQYQKFISKKQVFC
jgi:hypothetical protein